jgi:hypothetical protein
MNARSPPEQILTPFPRYSHVDGHEPDSNLTKRKSLSQHVHKHMGSAIFLLRSHHLFSIFMVQPAIAAHGFGDKCNRGTAKLNRKTKAI